MNHITAFELPCIDQSASTLFAELPGEVRDRIFTYVLSCYENTAKTWDTNSSYVRPDYHAPQAADTALLRTCQSVYTESWFRPWVSAAHTFWLAWEGRRPGDDENMTPEKLQPVLDQLHASHGEVEINHVRVFAQLCSLEDGDEIGTILDLQHFFPRQITITIRHHDWWSWENDARLCIEADWVNNCRLPDSVKVFAMELESLQRKKPQVDDIAHQMVEGWSFLRKDETIMSAKQEDCSVDTWSGSSTWEQERWIRDETKPDTNEYYVKTIRWKPNPRLTKCKSPCSLRASHTFAEIQSGRSYITTGQLEAAAVPLGLTADEAVRRVEAWERDNPPFEGSEHGSDALDADSDDEHTDEHVEQDDEEDSDFEL